MTVDYLQQINPLAETADNQLVAADAKLNFDDNAAYRRKEIFALRDTTQEDPREVYLLVLLFVLHYMGLNMQAVALNQPKLYHFSPRVFIPAWS